jgi:hypothetical protein
MMGAAGVVTVATAMISIVVVVVAVQWWWYESILWDIVGLQDVSTLENGARRFHQMTASDYAASSQRHIPEIPEERNPQVHGCESLRTRNTMDDKFEFNATSCRQCAGARESPDLARQEARPWQQTDMRGMWQPPPLPQPILTLAISGGWKGAGGGGSGGVHAAKYKRLKLRGGLAWRPFKWLLSKLPLQRKLNYSSAAQSWTDEGYAYIAYCCK